MKKLWSYMKEYRRECVLGPLFKLLEASFELLVPLVMAAVIDTGIKNADRDYVIRMCLVLVGLGVVGLCCSLTAQFFAAKASVGFAAKLRAALFGRVQSLSYADLDREGTSTMITRMTSDVNQVQNGVNLTLRLLLRSPFVVFGAMVMAFTIDWKAALVFVAVIPLLSVVVFGVMLWTMPRYKRVQAGLDQVLSAARENLTGVRVVRAFGREEAEIEGFEAQNNALTHLQVFVGKVSALMNPVTYIIVNLGAVALIWAGALRVDAGLITQGAVVALLNYMSQILVELVKLANLLILISKAMASMNRVDSVFQVTSSIETDPALAAVPAAQGTGAPAVELKDVDFVYSGATEPALQGISFQALPGQTVGIIGGTGSGKSTLANLICRFYDSSSGAVFQGGVNVQGMEEGRLRRQVAIVHQKAVLFSGTVRENMRWGKEDATDEEIYRALDIAQARDFVEEKGQGLDLEIEQGGKNLSGGQRQRLTIARALVQQPQILILDDSASALDFATDARLRSSLKENTQGMTVFLISQRASTIKNADAVLVLEDGRMAGWGTHEQLLENCPIYQEICHSQGIFHTQASEKEVQ